jgi:hypothetical protein
MTDHKLPAPTLAEIEDALHDALTALLRHRERRQRTQPREPFGFISAATLAATDWGPIELVRDPVREGIEYALCELGKLLHAEVGDAGMEAAAWRVASRSRSKRGVRINVLSKTFDGIGSWLA